MSSGLRYEHQSINLIQMRENKVIVKATRLVLAHNHTPLLSQSHMLFVPARWLKVSHPTPRSDSLRVTNLHQPNVSLGTQHTRSIFTFPSENKKNRKNKMLSGRVAMPLELPSWLENQLRCRLRSLMN